MAFCLLHDDDHQDLKCRIANPIAFEEQDGYEVVNVLLETRDEYMHSDNFILNKYPSLCKICPVVFP